MLSRSIRSFIFSIYEADVRGVDAEVVSVTGDGSISSSISTALALKRYTHLARARNRVELEVEGDVQNSRQNRSKSLA